MTFVTRKVMLCPNCEKEMKAIESIKELGYIPYDWYEMGDSILDNHNIWMCKKCKILQVEKTDILSKVIGWFKS